MAMVKRAPHISTPYSAYHHTQMPQEDEELTHVGPGTPCGEYFRRFWQPVPIDRELKDLPIRVRLLGEDLCLFRDKSGRVGLLEIRCPHRGTSLEYGLVEEKGIRCCYHGWLFDVDGRILDTPNEPPESTYKEKLCHGAYPVTELEGIYFTYMGPPEKYYPFPLYDTLQMSGYHLVAGKPSFAPCNWLQIAENSQDPSHTAFLHTRVSVGQFFNEKGEATMEFGEVGELDWIETPIGMAYVNTRRSGNDVWVRIGEIIHPNMQQTAPNPSFPQVYEEGQNERRDFLWFTKWLVPIDDTNTLSVRYLHHRDGSSTISHSNPLLGDGGGNTADRPYEDRQRVPGDYEAEVGQGPITIHALEHLGAADRGVTMYRKLLRQGIRAVQRGEDPKGVDRENREVVHCFGGNTMVYLPPAATPEEDKKLLKATGLRVAKGYLKNPPHVNGYAK
jgi:phenylpropionate dioxygenase-like ring-hydroxylating dioxygenase large terminal subunit